MLKPPEQRPRPGGHRKYKNRRKLPVWSFFFHDGVHVLHKGTIKLHQIANIVIILKAERTFVNGKDANKFV